MSVLQEGTEVATAPLCRALNVSRATVYRRMKPPVAKTARPRPARALTAQERKQVLDTLNSDEFMDCSPAAVYGTLLDRQEYLCSLRTMYRILEKEGLTRERRNQLTHPAYVKPELIATGPNQVWSWDITKLKGPAKWNHYHLYVILDIYSRHVVGWMVADRESATLAKELIRETCERQGIVKNQLTIHADRGTSMRSKAVAFLLADLGITKTHSRPYTSSDNPFSEAQFKTMKYCPEFPNRFGSIFDARTFGQYFFPWYNEKHRHSALGFMTPADVHYGRVQRRAGTSSSVSLPDRPIHGRCIHRGQPLPHEQKKSRLSL